MSCDDTSLEKRKTKSLLESPKSIVTFNNNAWNPNEMGEGIGKIQSKGDPMLALKPLKKTVV